MPRRSYSGVITAAVFIFLEIAAIVLMSHTRSLQNIWLNRISHRTLAALWGGSERIRGYFSLEKTNATLAGENVMLMERLRSLTDALGGEPSTSGIYRYVPARIVKASRNSQHNYIILDKGSADGVQEHSGIVCANGVVGVVEAVSEHYCYGITLQNALMTVSARVGRSGIAAPLVWDGKRSDRALLKDIPAHYEITPGDTVWTSGFSGIFPPDIPLGITGETRSRDGAVNETQVQLLLDFRAIRDVAIVENTTLPELRQLEKEVER